MENKALSTTEAAVARWLVIHDELLRGITHALSNRIATIAASAYLLEQGDVPVEQTIESLRTETDRMDTVLQHLRQLPERPGAEAEPMTVDDACATAVKVHAHHGELRDFECDLEVDADVYPIWAEPQSFTHAVLVALTAAKRNAVPGSRVLVQATGDVNVVRIRIIAREPIAKSDPLNATDAATARWLLTRNGGTAREVDFGCELEVPTLLAIRRARKG
ncbi:MAG: hypothetical protein ABI120_11985 [Gemmatimonadaceae bacterium]